MNTHGGVEIYFTSAVAEVSGQLRAPAALRPEQSPRYPFDRRPDGPQSRSGRHEEKNLALQGIQPAVRRYADRAIRAPLNEPRVDRAIGLVLDFIHRLVCGRQNTTTFRRLDLSPSSGGWGRINLLSWAR
jgi:hypothetical protein